MSEPQVPSTKLEDILMDIYNRLKKLEWRYDKAGQEKCISELTEIVLPLGVKFEPFEYKEGKESLEFANIKAKAVAIVLKKIDDIWKDKKEYTTILESIRGLKPKKKT